MSLHEMGSRVSEVGVFANLRNLRLMEGTEWAFACACAQIKARQAQYHWLYPSEVDQALAGEIWHDKTFRLHVPRQQEAPESEEPCNNKENILEGLLERDLSQLGLKDCCRDSCSNVGILWRSLALCTP